MRRLDILLAGISLLLILFLGTRCQKKNSKPSREFSDKEFEAEVTRHSNDSVLINKVFQVAGWKPTADGIAIFNYDTQDKNILSEYSSETSNLIQSGLNYGNGPGEYVAFNPGESGNDSDMLSYDIMRQSMFIYDMSKVPFSVKAQYKLPTDEDGMTNPYTYISQVDDDNFLMKFDSPDKSEWHYVNTKDNKILWRYPNPNRKVEYSYTPYDFMQSISGKTLMVAYKYMDLIEIYNITEEGLVPVRTVGNNQDQADISDYDDLEYRYLSVTSDGVNFYCLRSNDGDETGNVIESYAVKDGNPVNKYVLDRDIESISFDKIKNRLIGYLPKQNSSVFYIWDWD